MPSTATAPARHATIPRARLVAAVTIAGLVLSALFCLVEPGLVQLADNRVLDSLTRHRVRQAVNAQPGLADRSGRPDQVVIVDIDEESLAVAGQWPWPRYLTGGIVRRIAEALPTAVGVDILFSEPDRTSSPPSARRSSATLGWTSPSRACRAAWRTTTPTSAACWQRQRPWAR